MPESTPSLADATRGQFPAGWLVGAVLLVSIGLFLFMISQSLAHLRALAGGLSAFDTRPGGYDASEARALLEALGAEGRDYYARVQLRIDTLYPATYALSRGLLILWFARPGFASSGGLAWPYKLALLAAPAAACAFDWVENAGIAAMLESWPSLAADVVVRTSALTVAKSAASTVTESTVVLLLVATLWRRFRSARLQQSG